MKSISHTLITCYLLFTTCYLSAQPFTHADTLRGSNGPGRDWWDVQRYDLNVKFNIQDSSINGRALICFNQLKKGSFMQIDLQPPLTIDSLSYITTQLKITVKDSKNSIDSLRNGNTYFIPVPDNFYNSENL